MRSKARCPEEHFTNPENCIDVPKLDASGRVHVKGQVVYVDSTFSPEYLPGGGWWLMCQRCAFEYYEKGVLHGKGIPWDDHKKLMKFWGERSLHSSALSVYREHILEKLSSGFAEGDL